MQPAEPAERLVCHPRCLAEWPAERLVCQQKYLVEQPAERLVCLQKNHTDSLLDQFLVLLAIQISHYFQSEPGWVRQYASGFLSPFLRSCGPWCLDVCQTRTTQLPPETPVTAAAMASSIPTSYVFSSSIPLLFAVSWKIQSQKFNRYVLVPWIQLYTSINTLKKNCFKYSFHFMCYFFNCSTYPITWKQRPRNQNKSTSLLRSTNEPTAKLITHA